jgi:hypothetical protein
MTHNKPLALTIGLILGVLLVLTIEWLSPQCRKSRWKDIANETQAKLLDCQEEREIYRIDMAKRQALDEQTWRGFYKLDTIKPDTLDTLGME